MHEFATCRGNPAHRLGASARRNSWPTLRQRTRPPPQPAGDLRNACWGIERILVGVRTSIKGGPEPSGTANSNKESRDSTWGPPLKAANLRGIPDGRYSRNSEDYAGLGSGRLLVSPAFAV